MKIKKNDIVKYVFYVLCVLFFIWLCVSYIEVVSNNLNPNYVYNENNAFVVFGKLRKAYDACRGLE